ncbi:MAG: hypothetical protein ACR2MP_29180 [Streptosporangiaceae bacterium]
MGRAGRHRVLARSWSALGDQLIGHYAAVLGERSGAAGHPGPLGGPGPVGPVPERGTPTGARAA